MCEEPVQLPEDWREMVRRGGGGGGGTPAAAGAHPSHEINSERSSELSLAQHGLEFPYC